MSCTDSTSRTSRDRRTDVVQPRPGLCSRPSRPLGRLGSGQARAHRFGGRPRRASTARRPPSAEPTASSRSSTGRAAARSGGRCKHVAALVITAADEPQRGRFAPVPTHRAPARHRAAGARPGRLELGDAVARPHRHAGALLERRSARDRAGGAEQRLRRRRSAAAQGPPDATGRARRLGQRLPDLERPRLAGRASAASTAPTRSPPFGSCAPPSRRAEAA